MDSDTETLRTPIIHPINRPSKRVVDLWFEDGNIVVQAEDYQFRLFKSFLTSRSVIFEDTLSIPQPEDAEVIEGCPVLRIHDSPADAAHFFSAIYDTASFLPYPAPTTFEKVAGILRLSAKYEVGYLRKRALEHLSSGYPISLRSWKELNVSAASFLVLPSDALATINLAREVGCLWVLPTAFYDYCKHTGPAEIFRGTLQDGVLLSLCDADKQLCLDARETQRDGSKDLDEFLLAPPPLDCTNENREACCRARLTWLHYINTRRQDGFWLDPTEIWGHWETFGSHVCEPCLDACQKIYADVQKSIWVSIPRMFRLPSWEELAAEKRAALDIHVHYDEFSSFPALLSCFATSSAWPRMNQPKYNSQTTYLPQPCFSFSFNCSSCACGVYIRLQLY
ncbi:hypothetical protein C8J57DRAFT_262601 [Mycena rebaudengoi]|nr:hypothetical protein C8J57DRAFT_262601 [Mycena rebaudengoi]